MMGKFKIGDRVRVTKDGLSTTGAGGMLGYVRHITEYGDRYPIQVEMDKGGEYQSRAHVGSYRWSWFSVDALEHVAVAQQQQLTIREGAYYRTRDGRKVGPMKPDGESFVWTEVDGVVRSFEREGGGHYIDELNLVAEWIDEPAATNDNASLAPTTGFTVPLCAGDLVTDHVAADKIDSIGDIVRRLERLESAMWQRAA